jgi:hypothetical protein
MTPTRTNLLDLGQLVREQGLEAKRAAEAGDDFERGAGLRLLRGAFADAAAGDSVQSPLADLSLDGFDADRDLL